MLHNTHIEGYDSTAELAEELGNLRYDTLSDLLHQLSEKITRDGRKDAARGRQRLAAGLAASARHLAAAAGEMEEVWQICAPRMPDTESKTSPTS